MAAPPPQPVGHHRLSRRSPALRRFLQGELPATTVQGVGASP